MSAPKPSVLLINRVHPPERGATGRMMQNLSKALEASGWNVTIVAMGDKKNSYTGSGIHKIFIKQARKPHTAFGCLTNLWRFWRAGVKLPRHDIVVSLTDPPMLMVVGALIARLKKSHHVHWSQDVYPDLFKVFGINLPDFLYRFLHTRSVRAMNASDRVVVIGRCMAKYLKHHGVSGDKISIIQNWADFEVLAPTGYPQNSKPLEVPTGVAKKPDEMFRDDSPKFRVLYAGNIGRAHSMGSVIEAATLLRECKEIEFVFIGDAHAHSFLAKEREKRELDNIKFLPYQPIEKLRTIMESGDVHLVSMRRVAQGLVVPCKFYSGLTVGRPTIYIGPQGSEVAQVIAEHGAGFQVDPRDPKTLADAIYGYRMDGEAWFQAQEGALRAAQIYHPDASIQKWLDLLEKLRLS